MAVCAERGPALPCPNPGGHIVPLRTQALGATDLEFGRSVRHRRSAAQGINFNDGHITKQEAIEMPFPRYTTGSYATSGGYSPLVNNPFLEASQQIAQLIARLSNQPQPTSAGSAGGSTGLSDWGTQSRALPIPRSATTCPTSWEASVTVWTIMCAGLRARASDAEE